MGSISKKSSLLALVLLGTIAASKHPKPPPTESAIDAPTSVLIQFQSHAARKAVLDKKSQPFDFSKAESLGDRLLRFNLPANRSFDEFKTWMEKQPGVSVVEKNSQVKAFSTPSSR